MRLVPESMYVEGVQLIVSEIIRQTRITAMRKA